MTAMRAALAIAVKDWTRFLRQPFLMVISVVIPLVFIFFYSLVIPVSNNNPIMVADLDGGPAAARLIETMRTIRSDEGPYYDVRTTDPETALRAFDDAEALAVVVIPEGFSADVGAGDARVELRLNNINSDYSKNLRLRLDAAVRALNDELVGPVIGVEETRWLAADPTMLGYISTSLLLFGCLYAAMVNTGLQIAAEWNDRTVKHLLLAPLGRGTLVAGKVISGLGQSLASVALVAAVLVVGFDFRPSGSLGAMAGIVGVVLLMGAGIGMVIGVASKKTLATASGLITLAVAFFLVSGNEESMRGLAWGQPITALWQLSRALPTTYAFMSARSIFLTGDASDLARNLAVVLTATAAILALAGWLLRRAYTNLSGGQ
ncbi:ABC-type Na+ efflux pump, permease component [Actinomyces ruminicola]|uniref:ABC-type Na+ efflux pump, permease component n=1 Tax=Actinomyces ruminicola TaxID=332524 RepID=A0A1G9ZUY4_9ACTO|nr:ABC transporter permease [Actinomyces ruminicola]SDN25229.1 ABC-type Na+ efflux pump, permease component [Actinomyces ruminicola]